MELNVGQQLAVEMRFSEKKKQEVKQDWCDSVNTGLPSFSVNWRWDFKLLLTVVC